MPILNTQPYRVKASKSVMDNVIANVFHVCFYVNNSLQPCAANSRGLLFEIKSMKSYL